MIYLIISTGKYLIVYYYIKPCVVQYLLIFVIASRNTKSHQ